MAVLFLLLFAAGASFHLYAHWEVLGAHTPLWLALFLVCLFAGGLLVSISLETLLGPAFICPAEVSPKKYCQDQTSFSGRAVVAR